MRPIAVFFAAALVAAASFAATPYHLELEANPAAPFPYLGRFGTVKLHVFDGGVRAETIWLNGFSRNGTPSITVENPYGRMYTDVPIASVASILGKLAGGGNSVERAATGTLTAPVGGKVHGIDAMRYRIVYGQAAWIDIWTTRVIPENPQLHAIVNEILRGISPGTYAVARSIPGMPLYVELNFRRFHKLPLLRTKSLAFNNAGEAAALKVGALYFKAPLLDSIWK